MEKSWPQSFPNLCLTQIGSLTHAKDGDHPFGMAFEHFKKS
jgi:hypothetical protein